MQTQPIDTFKDRHTNISPQLDKIIEQVVAHTQQRFTPTKVLNTSDYYGNKNIGAAHIEGSCDGLPAILKIQGAKPSISEAEILEKFEAQNQSQLIRTPKLYHHVPWNNNDGFEALILEHIKGTKLLPGEELLTSKHLNEFLEFYQEYQSHCLKKPFLPKPVEKNSIKKYAKFLKQRIQLGKEINPDSPLRSPQDISKANKIYKTLKDTWEVTPLTFQHGHLSGKDVVKYKGKYILYSNLFWKWIHPCYDAVFAHHWHRISLTHIPNISIQDIRDQDRLWHEHFFSHITSSEKDHRLLSAALLERVIAALLVDAPAYAKKDAQISLKLMDLYRQKLHTLSKSIS